MNLEDNVETIKWIVGVIAALVVIAILGPFLVGAIVVAFVIGWVMRAMGLGRSVHDSLEGFLDWLKGMFTSGRPDEEKVN